MTTKELRRKLIKMFGVSLAFCMSHPMSEIQAPDPNNDSILSGINSTTDYINDKK